MVRLSDLRSLINNLEESFNEVDKRINTINDIVVHLYLLKKQDNGVAGKHIKRAFIMLGDALKFCNKNSLTIKQLNVIKQIANMITNEPVSHSTLSEIDDLLTDNDLEWIPQDND